MRTSTDLADAAAVQFAIAAVHVPAASGVLGSQWSVFHSGAHRGSGTWRDSRDQERRRLVVNGAGGVTGGLLVELAAARGARA